MYLFFYLSCFILHFLYLIWNALFHEFYTLIHSYIMYSMLSQLKIGGSPADLAIFLIFLIFEISLEQEQVPNDQPIGSKVK